MNENGSAKLRPGQRGAVRSHLSCGCAAAAVMTPEGHGRLRISHVPHGPEFFSPISRSASAGGIRFRSISSRAKSPT